MEYTSSNRIDQVPRKENDSRQNPHNQHPSSEEPLRSAPRPLTGLPRSFPREYTGTLAWTRQNFAPQDEKMFARFSFQDTENIDKALKGFWARESGRGFASPETFELGDSVRHLLSGIAHEVYSGCGFKILTGLDLRRYSELQCVILFAGLTSHIANIRANYNDHVRNIADKYSGTEKLIPPFLDHEMKFHTDVDVFDMLALFTLNTAEQGGDQYLASMASIYNILATEEPKVLQTLSQDWYWERKYRYENGEERLIVMRRPIIAIDRQGRIQINYSGAMVGANLEYPLSKEAPKLSNDQEYALKTLNEVARRVSIRITPKPGDILFLNNYALLHARDSWKDSPEKKRHLIRLWLHNTEIGWESAPELGRRNDIFDLPPEKQMLLTSMEWDELHKAQGLKVPGIVKFCHD